MSDDPKERGIWAEHYVRDFLSLPFISEFVFHSVQTLDRTQKEVADFLIAYPGFAALISQKTQKAPSPVALRRPSRGQRKKRRRLPRSFAAHCAPHSKNLFGANTSAGARWTFQQDCLPSITASCSSKCSIAWISTSTPTICLWNTGARRSAICR